MYVATKKRPEKIALSAIALNSINHEITCNLAGYFRCPPYDQFDVRPRDDTIKTQLALKYHCKKKKIIITPN